MSMGYDYLLKKINEDFPKSSDKKDTILLLDALDECKEAQRSLKNTLNNNPSIFMEKLAHDTKDFANVVVSCRKQFFICEEYGPNKTQILIGNPSSPDPFLHWQKIYLASFNDRQVEKYLSKRFSKYNNDPKRKEAYRIVLSCEDVFFRPLILSHIDTVLDSYGEQQKPLTMKNIYDAIVFYWIQREAKNDKAQISKLLIASLSVAAYMYQNNLTYLDKKHYKLFCEEYDIKDTDHLLRIKSLLNNDENGYKFSHRSFYEYLLAYWFFIDSNRMNDIKGLDFVLQIYGEIYDAYISEKNGSEIHQLLITQAIPLDRLAISLTNLATGLSELNHFALSEKFYKEALIAYRQLKENGSDVSLALVKTLHELAILHDYTNQRAEAIAEYQAVLNFLGQMEKDNPDEFLSEIAKTLCELATLYWCENLQDKAEVRYQEALNVWRQLEEKDNQQFLPNKALTLNSLATLHANMKPMSIADSEYREALSIWRQLGKEESETFLPFIAMTLNELAFFHYNNNYLTESEIEYQELLAIHRQLVKEYPDEFLLDLITTLNDLATLHDDIHDYDKAKVEFQEAMSISSIIDEKEPMILFRYF